MKADNEETNKNIAQTLDAATLGLIVYGVRALLNPSAYPQSPFTEHARTLVDTQFGIDGGYEIPPEIMELAFPPKNNLLR